MYMYMYMYMYRHMYIVDIGQSSSTECAALGNLSHIKTLLTASCFKGTGSPEYYREDCLVAFHLVILCGFRKPVNMGIIGFLKPT